MLALLAIFALSILLHVSIRLYVRRARGASTAPRLMVVLGSGGHTAEMLKLLGQMDRTKYRPRCYVVAATDGMSGTKAMRQEQELVGEKGAQDYSIAVIPRSREVGQSYFTSVLTTLYSLAAAAGMVLKQQPDLLLVNGPGTCIPVCASAFLFRCLGYMRTRIVYVESIARVKRLSLSGKILYHSRMADIVFVQWEELQQRFPRSVFAGSLY